MARKLALLFVGGLLPLQMLPAQADDLTPVAANAIPQFGTFFSTQNRPPLPYDWLPEGFPVYSLGPGSFVVDDSTVNYAAPRAWQQNANGYGKDDLFSPGDDYGGGGTNSPDVFSYSFSTNGLWMQIVGITNGIAYLNLNNATNQVYEIWSTESLTNPLANWNIETEVFPTNTSVMPFTVPVSDRTNSLYFYSRDWTGIASGTNQVPEWWFYYWFGNTAFSDINLDSLGNTLLNDYQNEIDPNLIQFSVSISNKYVASSTVPIQFSITAGTPYFMTALVDDTNFADANWEPYNANFPVNIGSTSGWHQIWVGLRGLPSNATPAWDWYRVDLLTPPLLVITNPVTTTVTQPIIELQGYSAQPLTSLFYDISNTAGVITNQQAFVTSQYCDSNTMSLTTNFFQAFDVPLTNGANVLTFYATDPAGNITTTNFAYTVDYSTKTNPPTVNLYWPQDQTAICGTNYTLRGWISDPTATVSLATIDTNADTNYFTAIVERDGKFWVENVPLAGGSNYLTLTVMDVVSNVATTNITVNPAAISIGITPPSSSVLWSPAIAVSGTISDSTDYTLWVNGNKAVLNGDGTWSATNVYLPSGGTAVIQARAIPNTDNSGNGTGGSGGGSVTYDNLGNPDPPEDDDVELQVDRPTVVYLKNYKSQTSGKGVTYYHCVTNEPVGTLTETTKFNTTWSYMGGGTETDYGDVTYDPGGGGWQQWQYTFPDDTWPPSLPSTVVYTDSEGDDSTNAGSGPDLSMVQWSETDHYFWSFAPSQCPASGTSDWSVQTTTEAELQTGGKGIMGQKLVFDVTASATASTTQIMNQYNQPTGDWNTAPVASQDITVLGKSLGTDGNLWEALPPDTTLDATVQAPPQRYNYSVGATVYSIDVTANVGGAGYDITMTAAPVCVGQQINFGLSSSPPYSSAMVHWNLPDKFVNEAQPSQGSFDYIQDTPLLFNTCPPDSIGTTCWYINGQGGTVSATTTYTFANGQTVSIAPQGTINIYRPSIVKFNPPSPAPSIDVTNGEIRLDGLDYSVEIVSQYPGNGDFTQIITRTAQNGNYGSTTVNANLDSFAFYAAKSQTPPGQFTISTPYVKSTWGFSDQPGENLSAPTTSISDQMKDYIMFCPSQGTGNIYVTLGTVSWSWTGSTTYNSSTSTWSTPSQVGDSPPTGNDTSDQFPVWTQIFSP